MAPIPSTSRKSTNFEAKNGLPGQSSKAAVTPIRMAAMAPLAVHRNATMLISPATLTGVGMFERIRSRSMPASWASGKLSTILSMSSARRSSFWRTSPKIETTKTSRGTSENRTWYAIAAASWEQWSREYFPAAREALRISRAPASRGRRPQPAPRGLDATAGAHRGAPRLAARSGAVTHLPGSGRAGR